MGFMRVNPNIAISNGLQNAVWNENGKKTSSGTKSSTQNKGTGGVQCSGKPDFKLLRIMNKFKAGNKLAAIEMAYLAEKFPQLYRKVFRITREREQLEQEIKTAELKEETGMKKAKEMEGTEPEGTEPPEKEEFLKHSKRHRRRNQNKSAFLAYTLPKEQMDDNMVIRSAAYGEQDAVSSFGTNINVAL